MQKNITNKGKINSKREWRTRQTRRWGRKWRRRWRKQCNWRCRRNEEGNEREKKGKWEAKQNGKQSQFARFTVNRAIHNLRVLINSCMDID